MCCSHPLSLSHRDPGKLNARSRLYRPSAAPLANAEPGAGQSKSFLGSAPLHNLVSYSANPRYMSDPLPQPMWDHRGTGQL